MTNCELFISILKARIAELKDIKSRNVTNETRVDCDNRISELTRLITLLKQE